MGPVEPTGFAGRALLLVTRDPGGRQSGRKGVLASIARSLTANGWSVQVVALSSDEVTPVWCGLPVSRVPLPSLAWSAVTAAGELVRRRRTFNEHLFDSPRVRRAVRDLAARHSADIVVADTLRTVEAARATGLPVVLHLDDLLSERYAAFAGGAEADDVLGFFRERLPVALRRPAATVAGRLVRIESALARRREDEIVRAVAVTATTSAQEAATLQARTGRTVVTLPMSVEARDEVPRTADPRSFVFLGLLDYAPNLAAVRWWRDEVRPALDACGGQDVRLTVVGHHRPEHRQELADDRLRLVGYVDDLDAELGRHRAMVAPVVSGTGVKTKVLDAMAVGLPVIATPAGVAGIDVRDGTEALVGRDAGALARHVIRLRDDDALARSVGRAGRDLLTRDWSGAALRDRWHEVLVPLRATGR